MLLLMIAMALTDAQQAQHDNTEWAVYQRLKADDDAIAKIWHPQVNWFQTIAKHAAAT
jgi:hypothetical protein